MANYLILQQVPHEGPGIFLNQLVENKHKVMTNRLWREPVVDDLEQFDACIIMGGPMSVNEEHKFPFIAAELKLVERFVQSRRPVLGICLGAQLIAKALGARVYQGEVPEYGWLPIRLTDQAKNDTLFRDVSSEQYVFQWHGETFDLPANSRQLAFSTEYANQAFEVADFVFGLQFHVEVTQSMIEEWVVVGRKELQHFDTDLPENILVDTQKHYHQMHNLGICLFGKFCQLAGMVKESS